MACWNKTKVHVAGVPLSSVEADCRLRHSIVGCDDVVVGVGDGKEAQLVLLPVCERTMGLSRCTVAPRLQFTWKRGPLAPVVGEGQVNLVSRRCSRL